jgi:hypothetical protein
LSTDCGCCWWLVWQPAGAGRPPDALGSAGHNAGGGMLGSSLGRTWRLRLASVSYADGYVGRAIGSALRTLSKVFSRHMG